LGLRKAQGDKLRPCDHFKASLHNLATTMQEMIAPVSAVFPLRAATLLASRLPRSLVQLYIGTEDIEAAY
jgi:hypothetical protein